MINTQDFDICILGDVVGVIRWRQICISLGATMLKSNQSGELDDQSFLIFPGNSSKRHVRVPSIVICFKT